VQWQVKIKNFADPLTTFFVLLEVLNVNSAPKKSSKLVSVMELWFSVAVFVFARLEISYSKSSEWKYSG
jgi:hypothetical protein